MGVTIHVREAGGKLGAEELEEVVRVLRPDRIGHGILAATRPALMEQIAAAGIVLEVCPTSNLLTEALADEAAVRTTFRTFIEHGVQFTIASDSPEMMRTRPRDKFELLLRIEALSRDELREANVRGTRRVFSGSDSSDEVSSDGVEEVPLTSIRIHLALLHLYPTYRRIVCTWAIPRAGTVRFFVDNPQLAASCTERCCAHTQ